MSPSSTVHSRALPVFLSLASIAADADDGKFEEGVDDDDDVNEGDIDFDFEDDEVVLFGEGGDIIPKAHLTNSPIVPSVE